MCQRCEMMKVGRGKITIGEEFKSLYGESDAEVKNIESSRRADRKTDSVLISNSISPKIIKQVS